MKWSLLFYLIPALLMSCKKSDTSNPIKCNGVETDTSGTGDNGRVFMPNAFSPNGDGLNDLIRPLTQNISSIEFVVYDGNSQVVFSTTTIGEGWSTTASVNTLTLYYFKVNVITSANHYIKLCGQLTKLTCLPPGFHLNMYRFEDQLTPAGFTGITNENPGVCP